MLKIGEKLNSSIPRTLAAMKERDDETLLQIVRDQEAAERPTWISTRRWWGRQRRRSCAGSFPWRCGNRDAASCWILPTRRCWPGRFRRRKAGR